VIFSKSAEEGHSEDHPVGELVYFNNSSTTAVGEMRDQKISGSSRWRVKIIPVEIESARCLIEVTLGFANVARLCQFDSYNALQMKTY